jgi:steroid 5-alpha reductase family enzyme
MTALSLIALVAAAAVALAAIMAGAWLIQRRTGNSGWIDTTWSFGVGLVGAAAAVVPLSPDGPSYRQWLVALLAVAWCVRLGSHIAARTRAASDDPRYRALMEEWGAAAPRRLFFFLQAQAAVGAILVMAIALAAHQPAAGLRWSDALGVAILLIAVAGEALADAQLATFKANPANKGRICDAGLWRWSRHPNYFFEWLTWVSYPVIALDLSGAYPVGWLSLAAPACMYWVLVYASGIPPLEAHMLRTRGDAFRAYQARTSAFFPWPPK